jgi:hypothetical protein
MIKIHGNDPVPEEVLSVATERERDFYRRGFAAGMNRANNDATPRLADLELRICAATDALLAAISALRSGSTN